jgi:hypothetical protein
MLGLIGGFLILAAFRSSLQIVAALIGLVSMSSFVVLACLSGDNGVQIDKVVTADIAGSVAAAIALLIAVGEGRRAT